MWDFSRWLESFWLMRWRPSTDETGSWRGLQLAQRRALPAPPPDEPRNKRRRSMRLWSRSPVSARGLGPQRSSLLGVRTVPTPLARHGRRGGRRDDPGRGRQRPKLPAAWREMARLRRRLLDERMALALCVRVIGAACLLPAGALSGHGGVEEFIGSQATDGLGQRWPQGLWTMRWDADNEFGHWDGLRLRKVKLGTKVKYRNEGRAADVVTDGAADASGEDRLAQAGTAISFSTASKSRSTAFTASEPASASITACPRRSALRATSS